MTALRGKMDGVVYIVKSHTKQLTDLSVKNTLDKNLLKNQWLKIIFHILKQESIFQGTKAQRKGKIILKRPIIQKEQIVLDTNIAIFLNLG